MGQSNEESTSNSSEEDEIASSSSDEEPKAQPCGFWAAGWRPTTFDNDKKVMDGYRPFTISSLVMTAVLAIDVSALKIAQQRPVFYPSAVVTEVGMINGTFKTICK